MTGEPATGLSALVARLRAEAGAGKGPPPVELWNPERCIDGLFEIDVAGVWRHEGTVIGRASLVRLFASILRTDADGTSWLVTPVEKIRVAIADAPFLAIRVDRDGGGPRQTIVATTNVGDVVPIGPDHPLRVRFDPDTGEPRPYVTVRGRLTARLLRAPFYELAEWSCEHGGVAGVWSGGAFFPLESHPA